MFNQEHLKVLNEAITNGLTIWNEWRQNHQEIKPDLSSADLSGANLNGANLSQADLRKTDLRDSDLSLADLSQANLRRAKLKGANLWRAKLEGVNLYKTGLDPWGYMNCLRWVTFNSSPEQLAVLKLELPPWQLFPWLAIIKYIFDISNQVASIAWKLSLWRYLDPNKPKINWVENKYNRSYRSNFKRDKNGFERLSCIDSEVKERIRQKVVQSIAQIHLYQAWGGAGKPSILDTAIAGLFDFGFHLGSLITLILVAAYLFISLLKQEISWQMISLGVITYGLTHIYLYFFYDLQFLDAESKPKKFGCYVVFLGISLGLALLLFYFLFSSDQIIGEIKKDRVLPLLYLLLTFALSLRVYIFNQNKQCLFGLSMFVSFIQVLLPLIISMIILFYFLNNETVIDWFKKDAIVSFIIFIGLGCYFFSIYGFLAQIKKYPLPTLAIISIFLTTPFFTEIILDKNDTKTNILWAIKTIFFANLVFITLTLIAYYLYYLLGSLIDRVKLRQHPQCEIIQTLCYLLIRIEKNPDPWNEPKTKYFITFYLEYIARIIEVELFHNLLANNYTINRRWLQMQTHKIAETFRQLKYYMLIPKQGTQEAIKKALANKLVEIAEDRLLESVDLSDPALEIADVTSSWLTRFQSFLITGFSTILPLLIVIIAVWLRKEKLLTLCPTNGDTVNEFCPLLEQILNNSILYASVGFVLNLASLIDPKAEVRASNAISIGGSLAKSPQAS